MPRTASWKKAKEAGASPLLLRPGGPRIEFTVPYRPPSVNSLYSIIYSQHKVVIKPEVRIFKNRFKQLVLPFDAAPGTKLALNLHIHHDWYYKNGNMRKLDIQNLEKVIIDCIFEMVTPDDCQIWWKHCRKVQDEKEQIKVKLWAIG